MRNFPAGVAEQIGYYVYLYIDPRDKKIFYVGKGCGDRAFHHLDEVGESRKNQRIAEIRGQHQEPQIELLADNLATEEIALRVEAAVIDAIGLFNLTNEVRGHKSELYGRKTMSEVVARYAAEPVEVIEPSLLIRVNRNFYHGMSDEELYEYTRGVWVLGPRREEARYALAVYQGVVREVYRVESWHKAGTTPYLHRPLEDVTDEERWEFVGRVAEVEVRDKYLLKSVAHYFTRGMASPTLYLNC